MKLDVLKFPHGEEALPIAECREVADDAPAPVPPWERMTIAELEAWKVANPISLPSPVESAEEKAARIIAAADEIYQAQAAPFRAAFQTIFVAAKAAVLDGDFEVAQLLVANAPGVPEELETVRAELLELF